MGQRLLLLGANHHQSLESLVGVAVAQANVDAHVHVGVPGAGVDFHKLVAQANHAGLVLVGHHQEQDALKQLLHALGHHPRREFNAALGRADGGVYRRLCAGLQCVGVQTHCGFAHAGAVFLDLVDVVQHWERGLPDKRAGERLHHTRGTHTDDGSGLVVQHVVHIDLALNHCGAGVDGLRQGVQRVAQDLGLDFLDVVGDVENGHRLDWAGVWLWVAGEVHERDVGRWQIPHHLVAGTHAADFAQLGDAVAVVVDALISLDVQDAALHGVGAVGLPDGSCQRLACQVLLVLVQVGCRDVVQHLVLVVAHRHQFGDCRHLAVRNQAAIVKGPRSAVN